MLTHMRPAVLVSQSQRRAVENILHGWQWPKLLSPEYPPWSSKERQRKRKDMVVTNGYAGIDVYARYRSVTKTRPLENVVIRVFPENHTPH